MTCSFVELERGIEPRTSSLPWRTGRPPPQSRFSGCPGQGLCHLSLESRIPPPRRWSVSAVCPRRGSDVLLRGDRCLARPLVAHQRDAVTACRLRSLPCRVLSHFDLARRTLPTPRPMPVTDSISSRSVAIEHRLIARERPGVLWPLGQPRRALATHVGTPVRLGVFAYLRRGPCMLPHDRRHGSVDAVLLPVRSPRRDRFALSPPGALRAPRPFASDFERRCR